MSARLRDARCVGLVLAGGSGRRLGNIPKGLLEVGGRRMVDRVAEALRASCDALAMAANVPHAHEWLDADLVIPDVHPGMGPLAGLHAALVALARPVIVVAWDMPFVSAALLHELRRRGERRAEVAAVVPESAAGALEPLCGWYAPSCAPELERLLLAGARKARDVVAALPGLERVTREDVRSFGDPDVLLASVNTPGELDWAQGLGGAWTGAGGGVRERPG